MSDLINREELIDWLTSGIIKLKGIYGDLGGAVSGVREMVKAMPSATPNNQVHLCDFCKYDYPECPDEKDDVIFGNGTGHDNICACAKFEIKPERTAKVECIAEVYRGEIVDHYLSGICGICGESTYDRAKYCSDCGAKLDWSEKGNK